MVRNLRTELARRADGLDAPARARVLPFNEALARLAACLRDPQWRKIAHDAKRLYRSALAAGADVEGLYCDTKVAAYLLEPGSTGGYSIEDTAARYLGMSLSGDKAAQPGEQGVLAFGADTKQTVCQEAVAVRALAPVLEERLRAHGTAVFSSITNTSSASTPISARR